MTLSSDKFLKMFNKPATKAFNESSPDISMIISTALVMREMSIDNLIVIVFMAYCAGYQYGTNGVPATSREDLLEEIRRIAANHPDNTMISEFFGDMKLSDQSNNTLDDMLKDIDFGDW